MTGGQPWSDAASGEAFGRYEPLFRIASGGMAEVYAARMAGEGGFEKIVALKRMLPTLAEDEKFVAMFLDEGRLAANISSPHVVQTLDLGRAEDDSLYLVMELVIGVSLSTLLKRLAGARRACPVAIAAEILAQAATGLDDAHEARTPYGEPLGIVHRDVTPQNVLVDVNGRVRITDFGVARAMQRMTQTQSGEVKGKLAYFAPEQARAQPLDRRSDVFALGVVGWELFAMQRLFAGENPAETISNVLERPIPRLDAVRADVPAGIAAAVAHALERDPARRTPTAAQFAHELRSALAGAPIGEVGAFVREHGGDTLTKIAEGIRSQQRQSGTPPSGSYEVARAAGRTRRQTGSGSRVLDAPAPAPPVAPSPDEAPTTLTPSHVLRVPGPEAPLGGSSSGSIVAAPPSRLPWFVAGGVIIALLVVVVALLAMLVERPASSVVATPLAAPPVEVPVAPEAAAPASAAAGSPAPSVPPALGEEAGALPADPPVEPPPVEPTVDEVPEAASSDASLPARGRRGLSRGAATEPSATAPAASTGAGPAAERPASPAREVPAERAPAPSGSPTSAPADRVLRDLSDFEAELGR